MKPGWKVEKLGDVCEKIQDGSHFSPQKTYSEKKPDCYLYITSKNIRNDYMDLSNITYVDKEFHQPIFQRCNPEFGDVLLTKDGVNTGNVTLNTLDEPFSLLSSVCLIKTNKRKLLPAFLKYYIQSPDGFKNITGQMTGMAIKRIVLHRIKSAKAPIPPIPEQQRIVSVLDEAFASIAQVKANAERNLVNARELYKSLMHEVFENKDWEEKKFGDVCGFVRGPFGGSLKKEIFVKDGYAVYEQQHAIYNQFDEIRYFVNKSKFNEMQRFEINPGNLIMSCSGTMGKVAIVSEGVKQGIINQALLLLKPNKHLLNTFIKYWMESENFQESLRAFSQGAAIQNVASVKILKEISVPLPPLAEQRAIVGRLEALSAETGRLEAVYRQKVAALEELKKSVLQKAFEGKL